jgi:hypothetical protein
MYFHFLCMRKKIFFDFSYDYSAYDYPYDPNSSSAYPSYAGYESGAPYAPPGAYDGYAASAAYPTGMIF